MKILHVETKSLVRRPNKTNTITVLTNVPKCELFKESDEVTVEYYKNKIIIKKVKWWKNI